MPEKIRLRSAARHVYAGRLINPNDEFEATPQDAEDLIALHFAVKIDDKPKRTYRRRDMKAEH